MPKLDEIHRVTQDNLVKIGYCHCGCGRKTEIAKTSCASKGHIKGQHYKYIQGHTWRRRNSEIAKKAGLKWCRSCKSGKQSNCFPSDLRNICQECITKYALEWRRKNRDRHRRYMKNFNLVKGYGITVQKFEQMKKEQNNLCAICRGPQTSTKRDGTLRELDIDHDHKTKKVRGLLCHQCNTSIGSMNEDENRMLKAIEYLRLHKNTKG